MAQLVGPSDRMLQVRALAYELAPTEVHNDWDANWLRVRITVVHAHERWDVIRPVLLTWELELFVDWLERIARTRTIPSESFTVLEPTFQWGATRTGDNLRIQVDVGQKFLPPRSAEQRISITFAPSIRAFTQFIDELKHEIASFPIRPVEAAGPARYWLASLQLRKADS
jgi:hypothetical protein